jgi:hypothetical protein
VLGKPDTKVRALPATSPSTTAPPVGGECSTSQILELNPLTSPLRIRKTQEMPTQGRATLTPTPQ